MQDSITQNKLHSIHSNEDLPPISGEPAQLQDFELAEQNQSTETPKDEALPVEASSPVPHRASRFQRSAIMTFALPKRRFSSVVIAFTTAGVLSALLTILLILRTRARFILQARKSP